MPFSYGSTKKPSVSKTSTLQSSSFTSLLRQPSRHDNFLRQEIVDLYTLTATPNAHNSSINLQTNNEEEVDLYTLTGTPNPQINNDKAAPNTHSNNIHSTTYINKRDQHRNGNNLASSKRKHDLTISPTISTHGIASIIPNRNKLPADQYAPTSLLYQNDDPSNSIETYPKHTIPTTTNTTSIYIPNLTKRSSRFEQTRTMSTSLHQEEKLKESMESYIEHKERPRQSKHTAISPIQSTYHCSPSTLGQSFSPVPWSDLKIPETTTTSFGELRMTFMHGTTHRYSQSLENEDTMNHLTETASMTSIHKSDNVSTQIQQHKRRKMDDGSSDTLGLLQPLDTHEMFKKCYKSEPTPKRKTNTTHRHRKKDNGKTSKTDKADKMALNSMSANDLVKILAGCTLNHGQEETDLDKKQELAFFEDTIPKDNGRKSKAKSKTKAKSKQTLANGFDGFSDLDDE